MINNRFWRPAAVLIIFSLSLSACAVKEKTSHSHPVSHAVFDSLLRRHVSESGLVNYQGFLRDSSKFKEYLQSLSQVYPNDENWSQEEQIAYWINAYNAFTIKLVMDHYPVASIKDIKNGIPFVNTVWDIKFIRIEGVEYDLNNIEHGILRTRYQEPRVHFALNCASISCPKLQKFAYTGARLHEQLDKAARDFLNDSSKNKLFAERVELSKILNWYWGDFKDQYDSRIELINKYVDTKVNPDAKVGFMAYDWNLNEQQ